MLSSTFSLMALGFSLGLMHALDADHVMAVSALSNTKPKLSRTLRFCGNWAIGHGGVLLLSGALLIGFGLSIPESMQYFAESLVGLVLIAIGILFFWRFRQQKWSLVEHKHGDLVHRHWHANGDATQKGHGRNKNHAPMMVGVLHGLAGSAPALALIPAVAQGEALTAMAYLFLFSIGVMLSMLVFGLGLGLIRQQLQQKYYNVFKWSQYGIAASAMFVGSYWLIQAQ